MPLTATQKGLDDRTTYGHKDDYYYSSGSIIDPYYGNWTEHKPQDSIADYMGTSQYINNMTSDGSTMWYWYIDGSPYYDPSDADIVPNRDGIHGMKLFAESRGYSVLTNYNQYIYGYKGNTKGFTYDQYKAEIDSGNPVLIQVEGHSMLGVGYSGTDQVILHDTWDYSSHTMTWGGYYAGMQHFAVAVIHLVPISVTYNITASAGRGGNIIPSGNVTVPSGSNRSFTIIPNSGYSILDVRVDGESKGNISSFTFTNVQANHTISAAFTQKQGWKFRADLNNTGVYDDGGIKPNGEKLWEFETGAEVNSSPAVSDGVVYIGSYDHKMYALSAKSGANLWAYDTGKSIYSSPAILNGTVYFGTDGGKMYALSAATGNEIWNHSTGDFVGSSPAISDDMVFFGCPNSNFYALSATTGNEIWEFPTASGVSSSAAVSNGMVYFGSYHNGFYALNATTGKEIWEFPTGFYWGSTPAVSNGVVYYATWQGMVYALNATTGDKLWEFPAGSGTYSSPAVSDGIVYIGSNDGKVYALSATTGYKLWDYPTGNYVESSPAVADGVVYIGSDDGKIYSLNATTGNEIWNYSTGNSVGSSPAVADGVVYVGSSDGKVYAIGTGNLPPIITSLDPPSVPQNSQSAPFQVVITGKRFDTVVATGCVTVDGINVTYTLDSPTQITAMFPETVDNYAGYHPVIVTGRGGSSNIYNFVVTSIKTPGWKFRANLNNTGEYDDGGIKPNGEKLWEFGTGAEVYSSPAVADGVVYIGSRDGKVYALSVKTGKEIWKYSTGNSVESSPAVADGVIYIGSRDGKVYAISATTGYKLWDYPTSNHVLSSPAVSDGVVYISSMNGEVYALSAITGAKLWNFATGGQGGSDFLSSSPAVSDGVVYIGSMDHKVYALNATTGDKLWDFESAYGISSTPAVSDDVVYIGSWDGNFYAINATTGVKLWDYEKIGAILSSPAVSNGVVYFNDLDNKTYALNATTGNKLWEFLTSGQGRFPVSSPSISDGVVYIGSDNGKIYSLNATTGDKLWEFEIGAGLHSSPAVSDGVVYLGSDDGKIYAIGTSISIPVITNLTPPSVLQNSQSHPFSVVITGTGFNTVSSTGNVTVDGNLVSYSLDSPTRITAMFPEVVDNTVGYHPVIVTGQNGSSSPYNFVVISPVSPPIANFTSNVTIGNIPLCVQFRDLSTGSPISWLWDFGDSKTSTSQNPINTYTHAGVYNVSLNATNSAGWNKTVKSNYINATTPLTPPVAYFISNTTSGPIPLCVQFTDLSTGGPSGWLWDFGNSKTSTSQNPINTYTHAGVYNVSLNATNSVGSNKTVKQNYIKATTPLTPPVADFTANTTSGPIPLCVQFTDLSTGGPSGWLWDFGDSKTSTSQNPINTYTHAGVYNVSLTATNSAGSNKKEKLNYINTTTPGGSYIINATADKHTIVYPPGIRSYSEGANKTYLTQSKPGSDLTSVVVDYVSNGPNQSWTFTNIISEHNISTYGNYTPSQVQVFFSANQTWGQAPLTVQFIDHSVGNPTSWYWQFGDGKTSTSQNPVNVYEIPGTYTVTLRASSSVSGGVGIYTDMIKVTNGVVPQPTPFPTPVKITADFTAVPQKGSAPLDVSFQDQSSGNPVSWIWYFGDGQVSTLQNPTHRYSSGGSYSVTLLAQNVKYSGSISKPGFITAI